MKISRARKFILLMHVFTSVHAISIAARKKNKFSSVSIFLRSRINAADHLVEGSFYRASTTEKNLRANAKDKEIREK